MATQTLGGIIKGYRIQKRLSQQEVSLRIGWGDTTRLSKIEQGRVGIPSRDIADKIIVALELSEVEKGQFLRAGGYLPTKHEIEDAVDQVRETILAWQHPAYMIDFGWNVHIVNQPTIDVFGYPPELIDPKKLKMNILDFILYPKSMDIVKGHSKNQLKPYEQALIAQFKAEHLGRENEKWYKQLIQKYAKEEKFREIWSKIGLTDYHKRLYEYEYKILTWPDGRQKAFHVFNCNLVSDTRFVTVLYLPASI